MQGHASLYTHVGKFSNKRLKWLQIFKTFQNKFVSNGLSRLTCRFVVLLDSQTQRYIINRVSYRYLDSEAVFQLLLFIKTQVTSGGISWGCVITLIKWLCIWTISAQLLYYWHWYAQFFPPEGKKVLTKNTSWTLISPPYGLEAYSLLYLLYISVILKHSWKTVRGFDDKGFNVINASVTRNRSETHNVLEAERFVDKVFFVHQRWKYYCMF
jgi:hypothetical protein